MTYLIDTDVLINFFKHKDPAKILIAGLSEQATLAISTLTIAELRSGWTKEQAGIGRQEYKSRGLSLGTPDTVIAATSYLSNFPLVTNNAKDYPMPELKLYKHTQEKAA